MTIALVTVTTAFVVRTLIILAVLGFCAWLIDTYVVPAGQPKKVYRGVVALLLVLWIITTFQIL